MRGSPAILVAVFAAAAGCSADGLLILELSGTADQVTYVFYEEGLCAPDFSGAQVPTLEIEAEVDAAGLVTPVGVQVPSHWQGAVVRVQAVIERGGQRGYWCDCPRLPRGSAMTLQVVPMATEPEACPMVAQPGPDGQSDDGAPGDPGAGDPGAGDPGAGDPGGGDPGAGDPGAGDPGAGDPGAGDPGAGDPQPPCGNGQLDAGEVCDTGMAPPINCWFLGYRDGIPACTACAGYSTAGCLTPINSETRINEVVTLAYAGGSHQTVGIAAGSYVLADSIVLDECASGCGATPVGLTLQPAPGAVVRLTWTNPSPGTVVGAIHVRSGFNEVRDLSIESQYGVVLSAGSNDPNNGYNLVRNNFFDNQSIDPYNSVAVYSGYNRIEANRFQNLSVFNSSSAVLVDGDLAGAPPVVNNVVSMNAIFGPWTRAIRNLDGATGTVIDHNSILLARANSTSASSTYRGFSSWSTPATPTTACLRNNLLVGNAGSTAYIFDDSNAGLTAAGTCATAGNLVNGHGLDCDSNPAALCSSECSGAAGLCALTGDPQVGADDQADDAALCLGSATYEDVGDVAGYDAWDDNPARFTGSSLDLGARETGSTRSFGGVASTCPVRP